MPNNYFQFKQFTIEQHHAAMKVGTDGVLLGAWANIENVKSILDIGTGTGLIALMLAQRSTAQIDAIDIDEDAISDARFNFSHSPWDSRLALFHTSLQDYAETTPKRYDLIVSNPPYFNHKHQTANNARTVARQHETLNFSDLLLGASKLLNPEGHFAVVLPFEAENQFRIEALKHGLFTTRAMRVKPNHNRPYKRILLQIQHQKDKLIEEELTIETNIRHVYTPEFTRLVRDFYLAL